jgi:hypothetical protein
MPICKKGPKYPVLIACLAMLSVFLALPASAAGVGKGDTAIGGTYGYASQDLRYHERTPDVGASLEHWFTDDFSLDGEVWTPLHSSNMDALSGSAQIDYHFGSVYVPLQVAYWGQEDSLAYGSGLGVNLFGGPLNFRLQGTVHYLQRPDLKDRTAYQLTGAVRFLF